MTEGRTHSKGNWIVFDPVFSGVESCYAQMVNNCMCCQCVCVCVYVCVCVCSYSAYMFNSLVKYSYFTLKFVSIIVVNFLPYHCILMLF